MPPEHCLSGIMFLEEVFNLLVRFFFSDRVALLNKTTELFRTAFGFQYFIFSKLSPSELGLAYILLPFAFEFVNGSHSDSPPGGLFRHYLFELRIVCSHVLH